MRGALYGMMLIFAAVGGCQRAYVGTSPAQVEVAVDSVERYDALWTATRETLREEGFRLALTDRFSGRMTTEPVVSQHYFEFWRRDVATLYDWWQATLSPIRRRVEVVLQPPTEGTGQAVLQVTVHKERLSSPERQFNESGAVFQFFGYALPPTPGGPESLPKTDRWIAIGTDPAMEQVYLKAILRRAGVVPGLPEKPAEDKAKSADELGAPA